MTRAYALLAVLRHGPMCWSELADVTGWPRDELRRLLDDGLQCGAIVRRTLGRAGNNAYEEVL